MKIAIVNSFCGVSAKKLAEALKENGHVVEVFSSSKNYVPPNFTGYDYVFGYGSSYETYGERERLNKPRAVASCVDKVKTFQAFKKADVPTVEYVLHKEDIPKHWEQICIRQRVDGRKAEDLDFKYPWEDIPSGASLYTQAYFHNKEYRVVVFKDDVFIYFKQRVPVEGKPDEWWFMIQNPKGFDKMIEHARKASKALGIDYVGYDVLAKNKASYVFLEANSGALLTPEAEESIVNYFNRK